MRIDQYSLVQINSKTAPRNPPYDQKHVSMSLQFPDLSHTAQNKNTWQLFQIRNVQPIPTHPHNVQPILIWSRSMFNPSSQDQDSRSNTVERFWIIGAKNSPVHQRRQMKCLLVAITILLHSLFSLSLSQYLCHGLLRCFFEILYYKAKRPAQTDVIICSNFQRMAGIRWRAIKRVLMTLFLRRSSGFFHRVRTWCVSSKLTQCQIFHHTILIRST